MARLTGLTALDIEYPLDMITEHYAVLPQVVSTLSSERLRRVRISFDHVHTDRNPIAERRLISVLDSAGLRGALQDIGRALAGLKPFRDTRSECGFTLELRVHCTDRQRTEAGFQSCIANAWTRLVHECMPQYRASGRVLDCAMHIVGA